MSLSKLDRRTRIKMRIRKIVSGTAAMPRMTVFRSNKQIYVQFVDDMAGVTLAAASSLEIAEAAAGQNKKDVAIGEKEEMEVICEDFFLYVRFGPHPNPNPNALALTLTLTLT